MQPVSGHLPAVSHAAVSTHSRVGRPAENNPAPTGANSGDTVRLSPRAQSLVDAAAAGPGKSARSPAHEARQILALDPDHGGQPFGRIVSQVARGLLSFANLAAAAEQAAGPKEDAVVEAPAEAASGAGEAGDIGTTTGAVALPNAGVPSADPDSALADALSDFSPGETDIVA